MAQNERFDIQPLDVLHRKERTSLLAYKLFSQRADGSIGPLFINTGQIIPVGTGEWLIAECHPTEGYAVRQGWHCTEQPIAPHLKLQPKGKLPRIWCLVEIEEVQEYNRPECQGGTWLLAQRMRVWAVIPDIDAYIAHTGETQHV